jgi:hypothetical protein
MNVDPLQDQIKKFREDYYQERGGKTSSINFISKSKQKTELARQISQTFNFSHLIEKTVYQIPNTNKVVIDYPVFKLYASEDVYPAVINRLIGEYDRCIQTYGSYSVHINLDSFTTSAAQRHIKMIEMFNNRFEPNTESIYMRTIEYMHVYNPPSVLEIIYNILKPMLNPLVTSNSVIIPKTESAARFSEIHNAAYRNK